MMEQVFGGGDGNKIGGLVVARVSVNMVDVMAVRNWPHLALIDVAMEFKDAASVFRREVIALCDAFGFGVVVEGDAAIDRSNTSPALRCPAFLKP